MFQKLAADFKPVLINILNNNRTHMEAWYSKTIFSKEISFEEYFIWLYHFIYTRATNILAQEKQLKIPEGGNFYYIIQWTEPETGIFNDQRDGRVYKTVKIGNQTWFSENLSYEPGNGNYWVDDNNTNRVPAYGHLYNWETANNVCPSGWHLPSDAEWTELTDYLGGEALAGGKLKAIAEWKYDPRGNSTDESGFGALPAGDRYHVDGTFGRFSERAYFWTSTPRGEEWASARLLRYFNVKVDRAGYSRALGFSVRCVKD